MNTQIFSQIALGPHLSNYLKLEDSKEELAPLTKEMEGAFLGELEAHLIKSPITSPTTLLKILDELLGMNFPSLVLKTIESHKELWIEDDFDSIRIQGIAAMMCGELELAIEAFELGVSTYEKEPSFYVNLAQVLIEKDLWQTAYDVCLKALEQDKNHFTTWEIIYFILQNTSKEPLADLKKIVEEVHSWAGTSYLSEQSLEPSPSTKVKELNSFYIEGEDSTEFLIEYTGALGANDDFSKIPGIIMQKQLTQKEPLPWQLSLHQLQAFLAMDKKDNFLAQSSILLNNNQLPLNIRGELMEIVEEVKKEIQEVILH